MSLFLDLVMEVDNPPVLYIMRGLPGSGKSTVARSLAPAGQVFSADDFWGKTQEEYLANWKAERLAAAHSQCERRVQEAMQAWLTPLVVDNVNLRRNDVVPYARLALRYGYAMEVRWPESEWWRERVAPFLGDKVRYAAELDEAAEILAAKNTHGVSVDRIRWMIDRWQEITGEDLVKSFLRRK